MDEYDEGFEYFYITSDRFVDGVEPHEKDEDLEQRRKAFGNYFKTREEAGDCLAYLKARAIIKQDTKGFKPDWSNYEHKFCGAWDLLNNRLFFHPIMTSRQSTIYFRTKEDIEESFAKHPDEWKTYLTYNQ